MATKRRRKRKKKSHKVYAFVVLMLAIAIVVVAFNLLFYVQKIEVSGNDYTDASVITESIQQDKLSFNSLYLLAKYRFTDPKLPESLDSMKVSLKSPWSVKVTVKEKEIIGYVKEDTKYAYFDKDGRIVLESTELRDGVPGIEGLSASNIKLYQKMKVKSTKLLKAILNVAVEVKNYNLTPDRITCADNEIEMYFGDICVKLGDEVTTEKMAQISPILAKLTGKSGVLHLEHYENDSNVITFSEESSEGADSAKDSEGTGDGGDTGTEDGTTDDVSDSTSDNASDSTSWGTSDSSTYDNSYSDGGYYGE